MRYCVANASSVEGCGRRVLLSTAGLAVLWSIPLQEAFADSEIAVAETGTLNQFYDSLAKLEAGAAEAYAKRDFKKAVDLLSELIYQQPTSPRWSEMRAQVLVDGKNFAAAVMDYNEAMQRTPVEENANQARLLAGRALALEGEGDWSKALADYEAAQRRASAAGESPDPYITNSIGNCQASLGRWGDARASYSLAANIFQRSSGFRDANGSSRSRIDGAVYAQANAALALVQLGDSAAATKELEYVSRRGPGSVDARAALAALYYYEGRVEDAERMWEYACDRISTGCSKYRDAEWLRVVRRWPPLMVERLGAFVKLTDAVGESAGDVAKGADQVKTPGVAFRDDGLIPAIEVEEGGVSL